eukprot:426032-Lingulodinium_polyedra.AAC.1
MRRTRTRRRRRALRAPGAFVARIAGSGVLRLRTLWQPGAPGSRSAAHDCCQWGRGLRDHSLIFGGQPR